MHWGIIQQLRSKRSLTRLQAVTKLASDGTQRALETLAAVLVQDPDSNVRKAALQVISNRKHERVLEIALKALQDLGLWVRQAATEALARINHLPDERMRWVYEQALLSCERRKDGRCLEVFTTRDPQAVDLAGLAGWIETFPALG